MLICGSFIHERDVGTSDTGRIGERARCGGGRKAALRCTVRERETFLLRCKGCA